MNEIATADSRPMSVGAWFVTMLVLALPLINLVMYLYWAFADGVNLNKRNFCRASLLWFAISVGIFLVFALMLGGFAAILGLAEAEGS